MGGYGALHLGLEYPNLFAAISAVAPSILRDLSEEPGYRTYYTFGGDQDYYEEVGPWNLARVNARKQKAESTNLRILAGERDSHLLPTLQDYHEWLKKYQIDHTFVTIKGVGHDYQDILEGYGQNAWLFWANAFSNSQ